jgi:hypothetical protein
MRFTDAAVPGGSDPISFGDNVKARSVRSVRSVNGPVDLGRSARINGLESVNGSIEGMQTDIDGSVATVNGRLKRSDGSHVHGSISSSMALWISLRPPSTARSKLARPRSISMTARSVTASSCARRRTVPAAANRGRARLAGG